jgi:hypothetical protein
LTASKNENVTFRKRKCLCSQKLTVAHLVERNSLTEIALLLYIMGDDQ